MNEIPVTVDDGSRSCVSRYEALRGGALGQPVAPEHRGGLPVLLRRGMWAWLRAMASESGPKRRPIAGALLAGPAPSDLVHLLADITLIPTGRVL